MISDKALQEKIGFTPHKGQLEVINVDARDIVICAGRRFGKSAICGYVALKTFLQGLSDIKAGKKDSIKIWIVAPSYELTQKVFEYFLKFMTKIDKDMHQYVSNRPFPQLKISESVWIQCKSAENPASLLGEELDLVIVDEAARLGRRIYEQYIYPTTSSRQGRTFFISTPFGQNWFYEKWVAMKEAKDGASFQYKSNDNPYLKEVEWERAKKILPSQVFEQEYEASFLPDAAAVFRGIDDIISDTCEEDVKKEHRYVMGVDLGKHEDFTVLTVIDKANNHVVYWDRFNQIDYPFQKERIKATALRYNNARIIVDSTAVGEPIQEDLARQGLFVDDFVFSNKSKKELVEKTSIFIEQKMVYIPPKNELIHELKAFGYQLSDSGNVIYKAPQGIHDDCVFSLALAVWGLTGRAVQLTAIQTEMAKADIKKIQDNYI